MENLYKASMKAQRGKLKKKDVQEWNRDLICNLQKLQDDLQNKTYEVSEYHIFTIHEPKERIISKLPFKDRVVQHAILAIIQDILKESFIAQTYSCLKKRGVHKCLFDIKKAFKNRKGTQYALKMDIKKFYPSIDKKILKQFLRRKFKDPDLLWLLDLIIDSSDKGCVLGNFTSQWFGNLYLSKFDHYIKQDKGIIYYFRYCDDFTILHESKEFLYHLKLEIEAYLRNNLKLELSNRQVFPISKRPLDMVGYVIDHDKVWIRDSIKKNFKRKRHQLASVSSYLGWTKWANARNLEAKILLS